MAELESLMLRFLLSCMRLAPMLVIPGLTVFSWAPALIRLLILLVFAACVTLMVPVPAENLIQKPLVAASYFIGEFLIGLMIALAIALPAAALNFAGRLADNQSGFSAANILNPSQERESESLFGTTLALAATVLFFAMSLHVDLLSLVASLFQYAPVGSISLASKSGPLLHAFSQQFLLAIMIAAPVLLAVFAIDVAAAFATRSMPQANVYFLALPVKVLTALLVFAATAKYLPELIGRLYSTAFDSVPRLVN